MHAWVELGLCGVRQEMSEVYKGKVVAASVAEVVPLHRKLLLSIINGEQNLELRKLHVRPALDGALGEIGGSRGVFAQEPTAGGCPWQAAV